MGRPGLAKSFHSLSFDKLGPIQSPSPKSTCQAGPGLITMLDTKGVHGSVWFGLDLKNQPNRITLIL